MTRQFARRQVAREGLSLIEVLVVIGLLGLLLSLLLPAVQNARHGARRVQCTNHVRQLILGIREYAVTHKFPHAGRATYEDWSLAVLPYIDEQRTLDRFDRKYPPGDKSNSPASRYLPDVLRCPEVPLVPSEIAWVARAHFGANGGLGGRKHIRLSSRTLLVGELPALPGLPWVSSPAVTVDELGNNHGGILVGFVDGHVAFLAASSSELSQLISD